VEFLTLLIKNTKMCGIAGFFNIQHKSIDESNLSKMLRLQEHRGPDSNGVYYNRHIGMAHNRLSLLDLSSNGNQPFQDDQYALIYNGELYNFRELKAKLPPCSYVSSSDTEVLFQALKVWGINETLKQLKGMFAFAWFNKSTNQLVLARDRIGIKPLFFALDNQYGYWFASEVKAILEVIACTPNPIKILFSGLGVLEKSRYETAWDNVFHVRPGTYVTINSSGHQEATYYEITDVVDEKRYLKFETSRFADVLAEFEGLFDAAVKRMLISDAPMGAYVSGGIDSSLIALYAARHQSEFKLFTANVIGKYSEFGDAQLLAQSLKKPLFDYKFEKEMALRDWAKVTWHYESPLVVHFNAIPFSNVSWLAHQEQVKAVLTGEGSDELFLGYPKLLTRKYDALIKSPFNLLKSLYKAIPKLSSYVSNEGGSQDLLGLFEQAAQNFTRQIIREKGIQAYDFLPERQRREQYLTAQMMQEGIVSLLWRNDRMGMINSIEARFPFLDEEIIAFAMNLPVKFKIGRTVRFHNYKHPFLIDKYIVRKLAEKKLPDALTFKTKNGFPTYGLRHVKINPAFFKNGYIAEILKMDTRQIDYMSSNFSTYHMALLGSVEIWTKIFVERKDHNLVSQDIGQFFSIE